MQINEIYKPSFVLPINVFLVELKFNLSKACQNLSKINTEQNRVKFPCVICSFNKGLLTGGDYT